MYDELVKWLREVADEVDSDYDVDPYNAEQRCLVIEQAADVIEELSEDNAALNGTIENLLEQIKDLGKPRWISVEERLPEKNNHYLVCIGKYDGEFMSAWVQVAWFCEKFYWEHLHGDDVFKETVTHWMPLPEPPKEET